MPTFTSYDGSSLAYSVVGDGPPLLVIPGGPARNAAYLGDLRGLAERTGRQLLVLEMRGTGRSDVPVDPESYRADRLVLDVESSLSHLGLERVDLLAHSAGANVALLFAEAFPARVSRLLLITPSSRAVGLAPLDEEVEAAFERRSDESWYSDAWAAANSEDPTADEELSARAFSYGRWDEVARAHAASDSDQRNVEATGAFYDGAFDPERTTTALAALDAPVRILVGGLDVVPGEALARRFAAVFPDAAVTVQEGAGHFPWLDDSAAFTRHVADMLRDRLAETPPLSDVVARLRAAGCVFAEDEAQLLISAAGTPDELEELVGRRVAGLPLEQVLGWAEFCGLRMAVDPGVFVPRRRTELLVREAAALAPAHAVVLDLCCGSGAVGAALAAALDDVELYAADIDPAAVRCARRNVAGAGGQVYEGDLYETLPDTLRGHIDILAVNAPYVPTESIRLMPPEARLHEPQAALDGGEDGLEIQRRVAAEAASWLAPGGHLLIETSVRQAPHTVNAIIQGGLVPRVVSSDELDATVVVGTRPGRPS